ncbi:MAG: hypothetical protein PHN41_05695 [Bacteroidales bacterium]|jgi:hypothetical protein|nr:hypothetical protein [Bacteroidales bacterium]MDD4703969.1 hypothetical protein [Bacteroidales bacterium]MDX9799080.1 hypothetical protein [Bacteroidales bacterium]
MKKILIVAILCLGLGFSSFAAETPVFKKGDKVLSFGTGFGGWGFPVEASFMYGLVDNTFKAPGLTFSIGGYFGTSFHKNYNLIMPGFRAQLNYTFVENLEVYGGLMAAFRIWNYSDNYNDKHGNGLWPGAYVGLRYYFTEKIGMYLETGYGITYGSVGVSFKF